MRVVRYIFTFLFLLTCIAAVVALAYLYVELEGKRLVYPISLPSMEDPLKVPVNVALTITALVALFLTVIAYPRGKPKPKGPAKPAARGISTADAKRALKSQTKQETIVNSTIQMEATEEGKQDVSTYARLEDPEAMARLVAIDQGEMSHQVVKDLLKEFFPELVGLVDKIKEDDHRTLDTLGRQIISVGRNMLKMTDKELSDNQFSIFQEKNFKAEQEEILRLYQPENISLLSDEQRSYLGIVVDKRAWESVQRTVRGQRTDWVPISLANAKQYL